MTRNGPDSIHLVDLHRRIARLVIRCPQPCHHLIRLKDARKLPRRIAHGAWSDRDRITVRLQVCERSTLFACRKDRCVPPCSAAARRGAQRVEAGVRVRNKGGGEQGQSGCVWDYSVSLPGPLTATRCFCNSDRCRSLSPDSVSDLVHVKEANARSEREQEWRRTTGCTDRKVVGAGWVIKAALQLQP
jgi:hypothetical protein